MSESFVMFDQEQENQFLREKIVGRKILEACIEENSQGIVKLVFEGNYTLRIDGELLWSRKKIRG